MRAASFPWLTLGVALALVGTYQLETWVDTEAGRETFRSTFTLGRDVVETPWTLATNVVAHSPSDPTHLLSNLVMLAFLGPLSERLLGRARTAALLFGVGAASALVQANLAPQRVLGLSGGLLALLGATAVTASAARRRVVHARIDPFLPALLTLLALVWTTRTLTGLWTQSLSPPVPTQDTVGHFEHLAGLLLGASAGLLWRRGLHVPEQRHEAVPNDQHQGTRPPGEAQEGRPLLGLRAPARLVAPLRVPLVEAHSASTIAATGPALRARGGLATPSPLTTDG